MVKNQVNRQYFFKISVCTVSLDLHEKIVNFNFITKSLRHFCREGGGKKVVSWNIGFQLSATLFTSCTKQQYTVDFTSFLSSSKPIPKFKFFNAVQKNMMNKIIIEWHATDEALTGKLAPR